MRPLLEDVDVAQAVKRLLPVVHDNTRHTIIFCCSLHGTYLVRERRTRRAGQFRLPHRTSLARLVASPKEEEEEEEGDLLLLRRTGEDLLLLEGETRRISP